MEPGASPFIPALWSIGIGHHLDELIIFIGSQRRKEEYQCEMGTLWIRVDIDLNFRLNLRLCFGQLISIVKLFSIVLNDQTLALTFASFILLSKVSDIRRHICHDLMK